MSIIRNHLYQSVFDRYLARRWPARVLVLTVACIYRARQSQAPVHRAESRLELRFVLDNFIANNHYIYLDDAVLETIAFAAWYDTEALFDNISRGALY